MAKKVFAMYLAKEGNPNSDAYAKLDLPASPWELWDALEKVRLQTDDILYMEIEDYYAFEYLAPHLDGLEISLNELNDLAARLATLDEVQGIAFEGLFSMEVQNKVDTNGGVITLQDLRDLAVSAKTDCYHVVDAADDAQLGRFYCEQQPGRGGMCQRRLLRRVERHSPGTPQSLVVLHCENRAEHFPQNLLEKGGSKTKRTLYDCLRGNRGLYRRPENRGR